MHCENSPRCCGWPKLAMIVLLVAITWGLVLPLMATTDAFQRRLIRHESYGINASAVFYTELEE